MQKEVHIVKHPLVQHKLTIMRQVETSAMKFRMLMHEISMLLAYEVTRDLELKYQDIQTPIMSMKSPVIHGENLILISILRAGNGLVEGILNLVPNARVGHIGIYRDPKTLEPVEYYFKLPEHMENSDVILVDPMLATGNSATAAISQIKALLPKSIKFVCLIASRIGVNKLHEEHPDIPIYTAAIDETLNDQGYIVPGCGDAGDRLYGTKLHV